MLNEIKIKNNGKLVITDRDSEICNILKIANKVLKRNIFSNNEPKEYSITIYYVESDNKWKEKILTTVYPKNYDFEFIYSNITDGGFEWRGNFKIDQFGDLLKWEMFKCVINTDSNYEGPICINLANTDFSLDIHDDKEVSVNNGMLKFNNENARISVIKDLKNKFDKENDQNES